MRSKNLKKRQKMSEEKQIKSKERVRNIAEVYTARKQVDDILDLVKNHSENVESTFLEPACGNGNFLVAILERKLQRALTSLSKYSPQVIVEYTVLRALSTIYGIDIMTDNVAEARDRLQFTIGEFFSNNYNTRILNENFWVSTEWVLHKNIVVGDSLNDTNNIVFQQYRSPKLLHFKITEFHFTEPQQTKTNPEHKLPKLKKHPITHYLGISQLCS